MVARPSTPPPSTARVGEERLISEDERSPSAPSGRKGALPHYDVATVSSLAQPPAEAGRTHKVAAGGDVRRKSESSPRSRPMARSSPWFQSLFSGARSVKPRSTPTRELLPT